MKKIALFLTVVPLLTAGPAQAGNVGVNVNINLGAPAPVPIIVHEPPLFLAPAPLGFSVAVGIPYDMFMIDGRYYAFRGDVWYVGSRYNGPWTVIVHDRLPPGLRKHKIHQIRSWRDEEYGHYRKDKDRYRGKAYRPDKDDDHGRGNGHGNGNGKGKGRRD